MENNEERSLNITLKSEDDKNDVVLTFGSILKKFRKYLLLWIVTAVVIAALTIGAVSLKNVISSEKMPLTAVVSFTFDGIEKGKDPAGHDFDVNSIKTPKVIKDSLIELGYNLEMLEDVRHGIVVESIMPEDTYEKYTAYMTIFENNQTNGVINAAQQIIDTKWFPTEYKVYFDYSETGLEGKEAANLFNTILTQYRSYFFETYGYNAALGSASSATDYKEYDYAEAVDVFSTTLTTLRNYVSSVANSDTTRFRSTATGFTFADLNESIKTIQQIDLDLLSSYITVNNVTKDRDVLINYYQYRIDALNRSKTIAQETLAALSDSIVNYEKDSIIIFGNGTDDTNTQSTVTSEEYNKLINQKNETQKELSTDVQQINFYTERMEALKSNPVGSEAKIQKVEDDLARLDAKVSDIIEKVNTTADEYYENVSFKDAYNILVPASSSAVKTARGIVSKSILPIFALEALLFVAYISVAVVTAISEENKKKNAAKCCDKKKNQKTDDSGEESEKKQPEKKKNENKK